LIAKFGEVLTYLWQTPDRRRGASVTGDTETPATGDTTAPSLTAKGRSTRAALLAAAREVFRRVGFFEAKITDITAEAKVAAGSFYTYFDSKEEIFKALLDANQEQLLHHDVDHLETADPVEAIRGATLAYLEAYRENVGLMRIFEQMSAMDSMFREARLERGKIFVERNARSIRRLQEDGRADTDLDAELASIALSSMVSRVAQLVFNFGYPVDVDALAETIVQLWVRSLGIK
jgi:AcrR family transcriptional regulator